MVTFIIFSIIIALQPNKHVFCSYAVNDTPSIDDVVRLFPTKRYGEIYPEHDLLHFSTAADSQTFACKVTRVCEEIPYE